MSRENSRRVLFCRGLTFPSASRAASCAPCSPPGEVCSQHRRQVGAAEQHVLVDEGEEIGEEVEGGYERGDGGGRERRQRALVDLLAGGKYGRRSLALLGACCGRSIAKGTGKY